MSFLKCHFTYLKHGIPPQQKEVEREAGFAIQDSKGKRREVGGE